MSKSSLGFFCPDLVSFLPPLPLCLWQVDLEPDGKVYVIIDLSESLSEGTMGSLFLEPADVKTHFARSLPWTYVLVQAYIFQRLRCGREAEKISAST